MGEISDRLKGLGKFVAQRPLESFLAASITASLFCMIGYHFNVDRFVESKTAKQGIVTAASAAESPKPIMVASIDPNLEERVKPKPKKKIEPTSLFGQKSVSYFSHLIQNASDIRHFCNTYGSFDNRFAGPRRLESIVSLITEIESNMSHWDIDGNLITSNKNAKGIGQWTPIGVADLNERLSEARLIDPNYANIPFFEYDTIVQNDDKGKRESIRATTLYVKLLLRLYDGNTDLVLADYNCGRDALSWRIKKKCKRHGINLKIRNYQKLSEEEMRVRKIVKGYKSLGYRRFLECLPSATREYVVRFREKRADHSSAASVAIDVMETTLGNYLYIADHSKSVIEKRRIYTGVTEFYAQIQDALQGQKRRTHLFRAYRGLTDLAIKSGSKRLAELYLSQAGLFCELSLERKNPQQRKIDYLRRKISQM